MPPSHTPAHAPEQLVQVFRHIAATRMAGIPIVNPALHVEAVGFERERGPDDGETGWLGVLVTPWCMNLLWWPDDGAHACAVGDERVHDFGESSYTFIGAREDALGAFEMCSLFSPMNDFGDPHTARLVAEHALRTLRDSRAATTVEAPARRAFLTGRVASTR